MLARIFPATLAVLMIVGCEHESSDEVFRNNDNDDCDVLDISDLLGDYDPVTNPYSDPDMWLSGPDAAEDYLMSLNLDTTVIHPDLSISIDHPERPVDPDLDIFFLHPTVKLDSFVPGNDDLSDLSNTKQFMAETAGMFTTVGRVIAPHYHSVNSVVFLPDLRPVRDLYLEIAYQDVEDAFTHYLANHWNGRKLVIMGYSQGGILTRWLFNRFINGHPDLMSRVVVVMPIGGDIQTDSFEFLPPCETKHQTGCYITFNSYLQGNGPTDDPPTTFGEWIGHDTTACVDVSHAMASSDSYKMSVFKIPETPAQWFNSALSEIPIEIDTPFMAFPDFYSADCIDDDGIYLEVRHSHEDELRWTPINYAHPFVSTAPPFGLGLHMYDFSTSMGDLLELTKKKSNTLDDESDFCVVQ